MFIVGKVEQRIVQKQIEKKEHEIFGETPGNDTNEGNGHNGVPNNDITPGREERDSLIAKKWSVNDDGGPA